MTRAPGRLPIGYVLVRAEDPRKHALDLSLTAEEGPKWSRVLQVNPAQAIGELVRSVGDRILVKPYCAHDVKLVLPDTPEVSVCELCNAPESDPDTPPSCLRNPSVLEGHGPHQFVPKATPEALLIVDLRDVLYCEPA